VEDHLTDDARRALELAREEAQSLNHRAVGTEHLLLGLVQMVAAGSVSAGVDGLRCLLARRKENSFREKLLELAAATYSATAGGGAPQLNSEMLRLLEHASGEQRTMGQMW
jgi:ATP-dependent Clp protease ATP-binding subunit ClpA